MNRFLVVLFFVISCSACTSSKNMHKGDMYELILKKISEPSKEDQIKISSKDIKKNLTRDQLDKINVPLLLVEIPKLEQTAILGHFGTTDTLGEYWFTQDGVSLRLINGTLVESRGLGHDLIAADAIKKYQGGLQYRRQWETINSANAIMVTSFNCSMQQNGPKNIEIIQKVHNTDHFVEKCSKSDINVTNEYWVDNLGIVQRSKQWHGSVADYVIIERL